MTAADAPVSDSGAAKNSDQSSRAINILLEEYKALYGLVTFRMSSLDRRVPIASAALATFLGSIAAVPPASQAIFLIGLPLAQLWLVRTTINHARSFEDVLRRIDEIERKINDLAGEPLLLFQSRHPSGGRATGGRTGAETVKTVYTSSMLMLGACVYLASMHPGLSLVLHAYGVACGVIGLHLSMSMLALRRYRYVKVPSRPRRRRRRLLWPSLGRSRTSPGRRRLSARSHRHDPSPSTESSVGDTASDR